jgi:hypothetical protein
MKNIDYIAEGIPCMFNNFKGQHKLEATIRQLLHDELSPTMDNDRVIAEIMEILENNGIENVVANCAGYVYFWYIGGQSGS